MKFASRFRIGLIAASAFLASPANATVIFVDGEGNLTTLEAVDYLAKSRHQGALPKSQLPISSLPISSLPANPYIDIVAAKALKYGVPQSLIEVVMFQENQRYDPNIINNKQACGLMQLIPATAARFGVTDCTDPEQNIDGGTAYLAWLTKRFQGEERFILAAYNAGEGAVDKHGGVPPYPQTINYVNRIQGFLQKQRVQTAFVNN